MSNKKDLTYKFIGSPMNPLKRGYYVEKCALKISHCEGYPLKPAKYGQPGWDAVCSKCDRLIQIKSSNKNYGKRVVATTASLPILDKHKVSYYNVLCKSNGEMWIRVISPKKVNGKYYKRLSDDIWGNHLLAPMSGRITKPRKMSDTIPSNTIMSPQKLRSQPVRNAKNKLIF